MSFDEHNEDTTNRRDFLKKATAIGWGAAVGGNLLQRPSQALAQIAVPKAPMPRRPFGRSGIKVSTLSLGGMFDILNNRLMLAKALEWGIDYWDTAEALYQHRAVGGIARNSVVPG